MVLSNVYYVAMDETLHSSSSETFAVVAKYAVNLVHCTGLEINSLI